MHSGSEADHGVDDDDAVPMRNTTPALKAATEANVRARRRRHCVFMAVRWFRVLSLPCVSILYWVGLWNFLDRYCWGAYSIAKGYWLRDTLYILIGAGGIVALKFVWPRKKVPLGRRAAL